MPTFGFGVRAPRVLEQRPMWQRPGNEAVTTVQSPYGTTTRLVFQLSLYRIYWEVVMRRGLWLR